MEYTVYHYDNLNELAKSFPKVAKELLEERGDSSNWQNNTLVFYPTLSEYAIFQLTDGLYRDCGLSQIAYKGAPDPLEYIDFERFGEALLLQSNDQNEYVLDDDGVVYSSYGFY